jgi:uroporphyrinogen-III synthase
MQKRILITRAPHQASALAEGLRARGFDPILIPTIELAPPTSFCALDAALACLFDFHWLLFTSANAVEAFTQHLGSVYLPTQLKIAAIGPATARAVEDLLKTKPDLIPEKAVAESLAEALLPHARQPDGSPTRFLLARAEAARDTLPESLTAAGAEVTIAPVYRTVIPARSIDEVKALFSVPETYPDAITFTSSSTVTNLLALLASAGLVLPPGILRISIGPITSQTLHEAGLPPHAEAEAATIASLVEAVAANIAS